MMKRVRNTKQAVGMSYNSCTSFMITTAVSIYLHQEASRPDSEGMCVCVRGQKHNLRTDE